MSFVGRERELSLLNRHLDEVRHSGAGSLLAIRGRRRVGKSRLVEEFISEAGCPALFFTATESPSEVELERFLEEAGGTEIPRASDIRSGFRPSRWDGALDIATEGATPETPIILVIDEFPYLASTDPALESIIQMLWDRALRQRPVMMLLIGSNEAMMEALTEYGRPLFDRAREMVIKPLSPLDMSSLLGLEPLAALDAQLVTGGFPALALEWGPDRDMSTYLRDAFTDPTSFLVVSGERILAAEFPDRLHARRVLMEIGSGARAHKTISERTGLSSASLERALESLRSAGIVVRRSPYSTRAANRTVLWEVADLFLRFWLRFVAGRIPEIERGRGSNLIEDFRRGWPSYRGRTMEQLVRESIEMALPEESSFGEARHVGSFWNRTGTVEVDLVGGDSLPIADRIGFLGSIKWRESRPFGRADFAELASMRAAVPGAGPKTKLVGVSAAGFDGVEGMDACIGPRRLVEAWRHPTERP